jgi:hypothetical protein
LIETLLIMERKFLSQQQNNKKNAVSQPHRADLSSGSSTQFYLQDRRSQSTMQKKQAGGDASGPTHPSGNLGNANRSGLPAQLKAGIENLSGYFMDDVKVHYNSAKPAQLQAHAYAQGIAIHLAPGQEKHLPHEAWHVAQQKQGRVQPTLQMKGGVNVNDDKGLEKEADVMGEKSLKVNSGNPKTINISSISRPAVQGKFDPALKLDNVADLKKQLTEAGYTINKGILLTTWFSNEYSVAGRTLSDIHGVATAIIADNPSIITPSPGIEAEREVRMPVRPEQEEVEKREVKEKASVEISEEHEKRRVVLKKIAEVSEEAEDKAEREVKIKKDVKEGGLAPRSKASEARSSQLEKEEEPKKMEGRQIIINYVWLGNNPLGPLEKFNILSWRALSHTVNIYTHPFAGGPPRTLGNLGLQEGEANVIDLSSILTADDREVGADNPKVALSDARSILGRWLGAMPGDRAPTKEHIYNMVDLTKSYIGGTQRGIVLDMKVGPSKHLQHYVESFHNKLISYTRGGNTPELPENQSIGTMQQAETLRLAYATNFNNKIRGLIDQDHNAAWFNQITGYHGQSYQATQEWLDVATKTPDGGPTEKRFEVSEPQSPGSGPFRVFKRASDQSNKSVGGTKMSEVKYLAQEALRSEFPKDSEFRARAQTQVKELPVESLW